MTDPLFLATFDDDLGPGQLVTLSGEEAHHAVSVKRVSPGESVLLANGNGVGARGEVVEVARRELTVRIVEVLSQPAPPLAWGVAQALAKGDRSELAVQMSTEIGARRILAWQASRSIVRWHGERGEKALAKWQATAREATKQSRRFHVPEVSSVSTTQLCAQLKAADVALVLHEEAASHIADVSLPPQGVGLLVVGPEGGISPEELAQFTEAGATAVRISDGVLRTSTAGAVALGQLDALGRR